MYSSVKIQNCKEHLSCKSYRKATAQCTEMILNKIEKTSNKTYTGFKSFLQRLEICFSQNPSCKGMESIS